VLSRRRAQALSGVVVALGVGALAAVAASAWARVETGLDSAPALPTACAHATPLRKVEIGGKPSYVAQLRNFNIVGLGGQVSRVVTAPLYPRYPTALLVGGIGIQSRHQLTAPVTLTSAYCAGGRVRLFSFTGTDSGPSIPRPASASVVRRTGYPQATLHSPPPISSPPDKPEWLLTLYFYKPGLAVLRFAQGGRVIDDLTFKVCVAGCPRLACR